MAGFIEYSVLIKAPNPDRIEQLADTIADLADLSCIKEYNGSSSNSYVTEVRGYRARHHLFPNIENTGIMKFESSWDVRNTIYEGPILKYGEHIIFSCSPRENPEDGFSIELLKGAYLIRPDSGKVKFANQSPQLESSDAS